MARSIPVVPIPCPFGKGSVVYVYYLDTPQPALVDTGVAASLSGQIEPALRAAGFALDSIRWILATHGHYDHIGAAKTLREHSPQSQVAIHRDDHDLLRSRRTHLDGYVGARYRYLDDPQVLADSDALLMEAIAGEIAADRELEDGDRIDLGGGVALEVVHTPGHSAGSVTFVLDGANWAFTGDAVQVGGSASSRFPLYVDPNAYRRSIERLLQDVRPSRLYLAHCFLDPRSGQPLDSTLDGAQVEQALRASLAVEQRIAAAAAQLRAGTAAAAGLAPVAAALGLAPDAPLTWPFSFFCTLGGYLT